MRIPLIAFLWPYSTVTVRCPFAHGSIVFTSEINHRQGSGLLPTIMQQIDTYLVHRFKK